MLVTSIFSFSHNVFYPTFSTHRNHHLHNIKFVVCKWFEIGHVQNLSFGKDLGRPGFTARTCCLASKLFVLGKVFSCQMLLTSIFSFDHYFSGICRIQRRCEFNALFQKSCIVFCAKPKEVDPIKLNFSVTNSVSIAPKYIINDGVVK